MDKIKNNLSKSQYAIFILSLVIIALSTFSYAFYLNVDNNEENIATTGCFKLTLNDNNDINLNNAYPLSDEEGSNLSPYQFTIKNVCSKASNYQVNIETLNSSTIDPLYLKSKIDNNNALILGSLDNVNTYVNNNVKISNKVAQGTLLYNEEKTYDLRIWIDEQASVEQSAEKEWTGKVVITSLENKNPYRLITLNPTGGEVDTTLLQVVGGRTIELPTPTRKGYDFIGWFDSEENGNKITESTVISENLDLYAYWDKICKHEMCDWFAFNEYDNTNSKEDVLTNSSKLTNLMNNPSATSYLLSNSELISNLKQSDYYDEYIVPVMLNYSKVSSANNNAMYNAKLPSYIYNYGTYFLISGFTYTGPVISSQSNSFSNTDYEGLSFYLVGTSSGSASVGVNYTNQAINPYGYTKLNINYNYSKNLSYEVSQVSLCNGSVSRANWSVSFSGCIKTIDMAVGENSNYLSLSNLNVNSNYRFVLTQSVNQYQVSGNYYNMVRIRSMYLS